jgi:hypothetical protein
MQEQEGSFKRSFVPLTLTRGILFPSFVYLTPPSPSLLTLSFFHSFTLSLSHSLTHIISSSQFSLYHIQFTLTSLSLPHHIQQVRQKGRFRQVSSLSDRSFLSNIFFTLRIFPSPVPQHLHTKTHLKGPADHTRRHW